jgi:adenylate cyclase
MAEPNAPLRSLLQAVANQPRPPATPFARLVRWSAGLAALACVAALMLAPSLWPFVTRLDHWTADWRTAYLSDRPNEPNKQIAVITITDETLRNYVSSPIDRGLLAQIVQAADAAGAAVIGLDVIFLKATEAAKDEQLIQALRSARAKIVLGALDERGELEPFQREFQAAYLSRAERPVGYVNMRHENDGVVRYTASPDPGSKYPKSFARLLAEAGGATNVDDAGKPIPWLLPVDEKRPAFVAMAAEKLLFAVGGEDVAALKGRVVLVGGMFPFRDQHRVPLSVRTGRTMPGVYIHAAVAAGLLEPARQIAEISPRSIRLLLAILALASIGMGLAMWQSTLVAFLGHGFAVGILLALDLVCFTQFRLLLPFTLAVTAWMAGISAGRFLGAVVAPSFSFRRTAS